MNDRYIRYDRLRCAGESLELGERRSIACLFNVGASLGGWEAKVWKFSFLCIQVKFNWVLTMPEHWPVGEDWG